MAKEPEDCSSVKGTDMDDVERGHFPDICELDGPEESETEAVAKSKNRHSEHKQMGTTGRKGRD